MTGSNREASIKITLGYEGGYTNDAADPGGPTNWGITIIDARKYWKKDATAADVRAMPLSVAVDIYRKQYWDKMACDSDPDGVDLVTFDYGVNSGIGRAIPCRSRNKKPGIVDWVKAICDERLNFLHHLRTWSVFGKGWGSRVSNVKARGVKMALQATGLPDATVKIRLEAQAKASSTKAKTTGTAATGTIGAPASTQIPDAPHHVDLSQFDLTTKAGIAVACIVLFGVAFYFVWRAWHHRNDAVAFAQVAKET